MDSGPLSPDILPLAPFVPPIEPNSEAASAPVAKPPVAAKPPHDGFTFRRFLEAIILFLMAVILLRSIALEPFGVPTGSMAQTLAGNHKACTCPRCGYPVRVGNAGMANDAQAGLKACATAFCPNCYQSNLGLDKMPDTAGDRLLVDKNVFEMRRPRRWEVAVFRCPSDLTKPYVKRVVGLPDERIQIRDGDIYINDELSRKSFDECRAVRVPVFDQRFRIPGGWTMRWGVGPPGHSSPDKSFDGPPGLPRPPSPPGHPSLDKSLDVAYEYVYGDGLRWPAAPDYRWLRYRHTLLDGNREEPIRDIFAYNGGTLRHELNLVHDFFVEFEVTFEPGTGEFAVGLTDGKDELTAYFPVGPKGQTAKSETRVTDGAGKDVAPPASFALSAGRTYRVEFVFFDRRVGLCVDGRDVITPVDLPAARDRKAVSRPVWLGAQGVAATVSNFRLFRDIHYASTGRNGIHEPWTLGPDEYFMLGDNSANSEDSRYWTFPGVPARNFMGKPLLLHQPSRWSSLRSGWEMQTIDWDRVKWIR